MTQCQRLVDPSQGQSLLVLTATPGTSWARFDSRRNVLTIHVFDLIDEAAWMERFKERYERRLMEIFE